MFLALVAKSKVQTNIVYAVSHEKMPLPVDVTYDYVAGS
jgi:hypothetical protein